MKKYITLLVVILITSISSFANNADLFELDMVELESEFEDLTILDKYIEENNDMTHAELSTINAFDDNGSNSSSVSGQDIVSRMEWGSFAWGFCCCPVGFFVVAVNDEKSDDEKMSYWIGVLASTVLNIITIAVSDGGHSTTTTTSSSY